MFTVFYCITLYLLIILVYVMLCFVVRSMKYTYIYTYDYICLFMDQARKLSGNKAYVAAANNSQGSLSSLKHTQNDVLR